MVSELWFEFAALFKFREAYFPRIDEELPMKSRVRLPKRRERRLRSLSAAVSAAVAKRRLDDLQTANLHTGAPPPPPPLPLHPFPPPPRQLSPFLSRLALAARVGQNCNPVTSALSTRSPIGRKGFRDSAPIGWSGILRAGAPERASDNLRKRIRITLPEQDYRAGRKSGP